MAPRASSDAQKTGGKRRSAREPKTGGRKRRAEGSAEGRSERERKLAAVLRGISDLIHVVDPETLDLLYVNDRLRETSAAVEGEKCYFALHGRGSQCRHCPIPELLDSDSEGSVVTDSFDHSDGRWYRHIASAIEWPDGRSVCVDIASDITERKRVESALRESETKYRQLLSNAQEGIAVIQNSLFCFFNPKFPEIVGRSPDRLKRLPFLDIVHPEDRRKVSTMYERRIRGEAVPSNYDYRIVTEHHEVRWMETNAVLLRWEGRPATLNFVTDVTERRAAVEALSSRETLFRSTIESTGDGILVVDRAGRVTHANKKYMEMWNIPEEAVKRGEVEELRAIGAEQVVDPEPFVERSEALYETDEESFETVRFKDGRVLERYSSPLMQDGEVTGRVWSFRDVSERKAAESALKESEKRLRLIFETAKDAMFVLKDGVFVDCNTMAVKMFAAEREQIIGQPPDVLFPPTQPNGRTSAELAAELVRAASSGKPQLFEWTHRTFDGVDFPSEVSLDSFDLAGRKYVQAIVHDMTERRHAEEVRDVLFQISQALNESPALDELLGAIHKQLGRLLDTTNFYVALYDEKTDTYTFPYHVDEEDELEDLEPTQLKRSLTDYVRRTERPILIDEAGHRELERAGEVELVGVPSPIWLGVPLKAGKRVIGVVAVQSYVEGSLYTQRDLEIMTFVSDNIAVAIERVRAKEQRELLEAQIQHSQKLESLGVLAGGIAHDFNNLLTGIMGNADLALLDTGPESPAHGCLIEIRSTAQRAADLSRQMLAYSGKGSFVIEPISVNEVVREMASLLDVSISKRATIEYELEADLPVIIGDATQIRQVIMNLITNASDAIGEADGTITVGSGVRSCDEAYLSECYLVQDVEPGEFAYISVSDTGCGMDAETMQRIFDPFFTTKFTGRGLGLASTLGIVRGHGGAVRVTSEPGRGTSFEVLLPVAVDAVPADAERGQAEACRQLEGDATVLVVDDEDTVREVAARMLQQAGMKVMTAADGVEALEVFRRCPDRIGCVLLDLTMPRMSGEETLRELRNLRDDVRVVLSSGYSEQEVVQQIDDEKHVAGFVQKPYLLDNLVEKIGQAISDRAR
ncbi:MAG: PAS domain S-box protein [Candidatus Eisenbacteria bacterium]|nr:PAS domain S-box protein [Candidatus Eisenbacteria bacterium]